MHAILRTCLQAARRKMEEEEARELANLEKHLQSERVSQRGPEVSNSELKFSVPWCTF